MRTRAQVKGRKNSRGFSMLIHDYFTSPEYAALSPRAVKCLIDLYCQFRGNNNGDLTAAFSIMSKVGWTSKDQLQKALGELLGRGWITITRRGGRGSLHLPTLYAVTFLGINRCDGKLEVPPNATPSNLWRRQPAAPAGEAEPPRHTGQSRPATRAGACDFRA